MRKGLTQDQTDMKLANLNTIFNMLYDKTPISRADLAKVSGMSPTSITRFVNIMQKVNLLRETPSSEKKVGRTATLLDINESTFYSAGINIDSTYIHVSLLNFRKRIVADRYLKIGASSPSVDQVLDITYRLYQETLKDSGIEPEQICGIGVSVTGVMDDSDTLLITSQLKWRDVNLRRAVAEKFRMENVLVENDCDSALIGQCVLHPEYKEKAVACICIGTGVGSAISYQGSLLSPPGRNPFSEIGHTTVEPGGMLCGCGNRGCLQTFIAEEYLIRRAQKYNPDILLLEEIHSAWVKGAAWARNLISEACTYVKAAINNMACVYNPDIVLICGESVDQYWDMFEEIIKEPLPLFYPFHGRLTVQHFYKKYQSSIIGVSQHVQDVHLKKLLKSTL